MHRFTKQALWEIFIISAIILLVLYRLALVYDFVPDAYQPSTIFDNTYSGIKGFLVTESKEDDLFGHVSQWFLGHLKATEKYVHDQQTSYEKAEQVSERCHENMIFRFFMFLGDESNPNCSESNMALKEAVKNVSNEAHPPAAPTKSNGPSAAAPGFKPTTTPAPTGIAAPPAAAATTQPATERTMAPTPETPATPAPTPEPTPVAPIAAPAALVPAAPVIPTTPATPVPPPAPASMPETPDYTPPTRAPVSVVEPAPAN